MLKDSRTYEIMRPQDVGQTAEQLVLGRHSGRHAVQRRCEQLGLALTPEELAQVYHAVITMGEHRKSIADNDLRRMVERVRAGQPAAQARVAVRFRNVEVTELQKFERSSDRDSAIREVHQFLQCRNSADSAISYEWIP